MPFQSANQLAATGAERGSPSMRTRSIAQLEATHAPIPPQEPPASPSTTMTVMTGIAPNGVTDAELRQGVSTSVIGRSANSMGNVADIAATTDDTFLRRVTNTLSWGLLTLGMVADNLLTYAKLAQGSARSILGVAGNATANLASIQGTTDQVLRVDTAGTGLGFGTVATGGLTPHAVTDATLRQGAATSVIGRSANSTGDVADVASATNGQVLRRAANVLGFGAVDLADGTNAVTGVLGSAHGGTDQSAYAVGDVLYASGTTTLTKLNAGTLHQVLQAQGAATAPVWATVGVDAVALADATSITPDGSYAVNTHANTQSAGTLTANAPSNFTTAHLKFELIIKCTNVQTWSWNATYRGSTDVPLPTATTGGTKTDRYLFQWNATDSKADLIALIRGF